MKKIRINKSIILTIIVCLGLWQAPAWAQDEDNGQAVIRLQYHNDNNSLQYLMLESLWKKKKVFTPQQNKKYQLYLDSVSGQTKIADVVTNKDGKAKAILPPSLKNIWEASDQHTFIVHEGDEELLSDMVITKSRLIIDTLNEEGVRSIVASVTKRENGEWVPVPDVELKVGVRRLGGLLTAGEEETYTTDSSGQAVVEFKRAGLPGDEKGNLILMARIDENEQLGYLMMERSAPWGNMQVPSGDFFKQRTLWSTRNHTPYWLLFMAYGIVIAVWGTLFYLIAQFFRIRKLGAG